MAQCFLCNENMVHKRVKSGSKVVVSFLKYRSHTRVVILYELSRNIQIHLKTLILIVGPYHLSVLL